MSPESVTKPWGPSPGPSGVNSMEDGFKASSSVRNTTWSFPKSLQCDIVSEKLSGYLRVEVLCSYFHLNVHNDFLILIENLSFQIVN